MILGNREINSETSELLDVGPVQRRVTDLCTDIYLPIGTFTAVTGGSQSPDNAKVLPVLYVDGRVQRHCDVLAGRHRRWRVELADHWRGRGEGQEAGQRCGGKGLGGDHFGERVIGL